MEKTMNKLDLIISIIKELRADFKTINNKTNDIDSRVKIIESKIQDGKENKKNILNVSNIIIGLLTIAVMILLYKYPA